MDVTVETVPSFAPYTSAPALALVDSLRRAVASGWRLYGSAKAGWVLTAGEVLDLAALAPSGSDLAWSGLHLYATADALVVEHAGRVPVLERIGEARPLQDGDVIVVGTRWLWFSWTLGRLPDVEVLDAGTSRGRVLHDVLTVGREEGDILVNDPSVSHAHCRISLGERGAEVVDLGSRNGTFVALRPGTAIGGRTALVVGDTRVLIAIGANGWVVHVDRSDVATRPPMR